MSNVSRKSIIMVAALSALSGAYASAQTPTPPIYSSPAFVGGNAGTGGFQETSVPKTFTSNPGMSVATGASLVNGYLYYPNSNGTGAPVVDSSETEAFIITTASGSGAASGPGSATGSGSIELTPGATNPATGNPGVVTSYAINTPQNAVVGLTASQYYTSSTNTKTYNPAAAVWNASTGALTSVLNPMATPIADPNSSTMTFNTVGVGTMAGGSTLPVFNQAAKVINDNGVIAGTGYIYNTTSNAFVGTAGVVWTSSSAAPIILPLKGGNSSTGGNTASVYAINNSAVVVGQEYNYTAANGYLGTFATAWVPGAGSYSAVSLPSNSSAPSGDVARVINNSGVIGGLSSGYNGGTNAVRWIPSSTAASGYTIQTLTAPGTYSTSNANYSGDIYGINANGDVVGVTALYGGTGNTTSLGTRPYLWMAGQTSPVVLGVDGTTAAGSTTGYVYSVNDADFSVGNLPEYSSTGATLLSSTAELWNSSGTLTELNSLIGIGVGTNTGSGNLAPGVSGWTNLIQADGITDTGWISGYGEYYDATGIGSYQAGFLIYDANAVAPEPTSLLLLGLGGLHLLGRRRKQAAENA